MFGLLLTLVACVIEITSASPIFPHQNRRAMNHSHFKILSHTETQFKGLFLDEVTQELKTQIGYNKSVVLTDHKIGEDIIRAYLETSTNNPPFRPIKQLNEFKQNEHYNFEDDKHFNHDELALASEVFETFLKLDENQSKDMKTKMEHNLDSSSTTSAIVKNSSGDELTSTDETPTAVKGNEKNWTEEISKSTFESYAKDITSENTPIKPLSSDSLLSGPERVHSQSSKKKDEIEVTDRYSHNGEMTSEHPSVSDMSSDDITITEKDLALVENHSNDDEISVDSTLNQEKDESLINLSEEWNHPGDMNKKVETEETTTEGFSPSTSESSVESGHKINNATLSDEKTDFFDEDSTILNQSSEHSPKANGDLIESLIHLDEPEEVASASDVKENRVRADTDRILNDEDVQDGLSQILEKVSTDRYIDSIGESSPSGSEPNKTTSVEQELAFVQNSGDTSKDSETEESLFVSSEVWNQPEDLKKEEISTEGYTDITSSQDFDKISSFRTAEEDSMVQNSNKGSDKTLQGDNLETSESFVHLSREQNRTEDSVDEKIKTEGYNEINPPMFLDNSGSKPDEVLFSDEKTKLFDLTTEGTSRDEHPVKHSEENSYDNVMSPSENVETIAESSRQKDEEQNSNELENTFYETKNQERTSNENELKSQDPFEIKHNLSNAEEDALLVSSNDEEKYLSEQNDLSKDFEGQTTSSSSSPTQSDVRSTQAFSMIASEELTTPADVKYGDQHSENSSDEKIMSASEIVETVVNSSIEKSKEQNSNELGNTFYETKNHERTSNENEHKSQDPFEIKDNLSNADEKDLPNSSFDDHNEEKILEQSSTVVYENSEPKQPPPSEDLKYINEEFIKSIDSDHKSNIGSIEVHSFGDSGSTTYKTQISSDPKSPSDVLVVSSNSAEGEENGFQDETSTSTSSPNVSSTQEVSKTNPEEFTTPANVEHGDEHSEQNSDEKIMSPSETVETVVNSSREKSKEQNSNVHEKTFYETEKFFNSIENDHKSAIGSIEVHSFGDSKSTTYETELLSDPSPSDAWIVSSRNNEEENLSEQNDSSKDFQDETSTSTSSPTHKNVSSTQEFSKTNPEKLTTPANVEHGDEHSDNNSDEKIMSPSEIVETILDSSRQKSNEQSSNELENTFYETKNQERTSDENELKSEDPFEIKDNLSNADEKASFDDGNEEIIPEQSSTVVYENIEPKQPLSSEDLKYKNEEFVNSVENDHKSTVGSIEDHSYVNSGSTTNETEILFNPSPSDALVLSSSSDEATTTSSSTEKDMRSKQDLSITNPEDLTTPPNEEHADKHSDNNSDEKIMSPSELVETVVHSSVEKSKEQNSNELENTFYETKNHERTSNENERKSQDSIEIKENLSNGYEKDLPISSFDVHNEERRPHVVYENSESKQPLSSENLKYKNEVHSFGDSRSTTYETEILSDPSPFDAWIVSSRNNEEENLSEQNDSSKDFQDETATSTSSPIQKNVRSTQGFSMTNPEELTTPANVEHGDEHSDNNSDEKIMSPSEIVETIFDSSRQKSNEQSSSELENTFYETKNQERTSDENERKDPIEIKDNLSNAGEKASFDDGNEEIIPEQSSTVVYENSEPKQPPPSEDLKYINEEFIKSIENDQKSTVASIDVHSFGDSGSTTYKTQISSDPKSPSDVVSLSNVEGENRSEENDFQDETSTSTSSPNVSSTQEFSKTNPEELTTPANVEHGDQHSENNSDEKVMSPSEIVETVVDSSRQKSKEQSSNELENTFYETKNQESTYSIENELKSEDLIEIKDNLSNADEKVSFDDGNEEIIPEQSSTVVYENIEPKQPLSSEDLKYKNEEFINSNENDQKSTVASIEVHSFGDSRSATYETEILSDPSPDDAIVVSSSNDEDKNLSEQNDSSKDIEDETTTTPSSPTQSTPDLSTSQQDPEEGEMSPGELMGQSENREIKILIDFKNKNNLTESNENRNVEEKSLLVLTPPWNDIYESDEITNLSREENQTTPERDELNLTPIHDGSTDPILYKEPSKVSSVDDNLSLTTKNDISSFTSSILLDSFKKSDSIASSEPTHAKNVTKSEVTERNYESSTESHFMTSVKPHEETTLNEEGTTGSKEGDFGISTNSETPNSDLEIKKIYWDLLDDKEDVIPKYEYDSAQNQIEDATRKVLNEENLYDLIVSTDTSEHIKDRKKSNLNSNPETQSEASILAMDLHETPTTERFENDAFEEASGSKKVTIIVPYETEVKHHQNGPKLSENKTNFNAPILSDSQKTNIFETTRTSTDSSSERTNRTDSENTENKILCTQSVLKSEGISSRGNLTCKNNSEEKRATSVGQSTNVDYPERTTQRYRRTFTLQLPRQKYYEMKLPQRASKLFWFV